MPNVIRIDKIKPLRRKVSRKGRKDFHRNAISLAFFAWSLAS